MTEYVDPAEIEQIIGARRQPDEHIGRADSVERQVYILHSENCRRMHDAGLRDLADCEYTKALARGISMPQWTTPTGSTMEDFPVELGVLRGDLVPVRVAPMEWWLP